MELNFCYRCGGKLIPTDSYFKCAQGHSIYRNPKPTVCVFFLDTDGRSLVLAIRGIEPRKGELDSIGGFVDPHESFEDAAHREVHEETGLTTDDYTPLRYIGSAPAMYDHQGEPLPILSVMYLSKLKKDAKLEPYDDVADIVRIDVNEVDTQTITSADVVKGIAIIRKMLA